MMFASSLWHKMVYKQPCIALLKHHSRVKLIKDSMPLFLNGRVFCSIDQTPYVNPSFMALLLVCDLS